MSRQLVGLRQPDQRSCGPACLVAARMLRDPAYAEVTRRGHFDSEVLALHRTITSSLDVRGALQLPWPRALGTPPWAVARHLTALDAALGPGLGPGLDPGGVRRRYVARLVLHRPRAFDRLAAADAPCALYVGSRWLPRHVVLVVASTAASLEVYEPSKGVLVEVSRHQFVEGPLALGGWRTPWFTVTTR